LARLFCSYLHIYTTSYPFSDTLLDILRLQVTHDDIEGLHLAAAQVRVQDAVSKSRLVVCGQVGKQIIGGALSSGVERQRRERQRDDQDGLYRTLGNQRRNAPVKSSGPPVRGASRPEGARSQQRQQGRSQRQTGQQNHNNRNRQNRAAVSEQTHLGEDHRHETDDDRPGAASERFADGADGALSCGVLAFR